MPSTFLPPRPLPSAKLLVTLIVTLALAGCDAVSARDSATDTARSGMPAGIDPAMLERREDGVWIASQDSLRKTPGYVVDSIFPPEEALRRFRAGIASTPPTTMDGSMRSADELLQRYWRILISGDTAGAGALVVSKPEFAYLYLPDSPEFKAGMPPEIAWLLLERSGPTALRKATQIAAERGSQPVTGTTCPPTANTVSSGAIRVYGPCGVIVRRNDARDTVWIASRVIGHRGIVKLLSFANPL